MTENEFYKRKIFEKSSIKQLRKEFPQLLTEINSWYCSLRYNDVQSYKSFLMNKLKQMSEDDEVIDFSNEELYELFLWWERTPKVCHYCSLPESSLEELHNLPGHINKRYPNRGKSLEIDRKQSNLPYTNVKNLALACYWCNNAKTDTFNGEEFLRVGAIIKEIWQQRLNRKL
jgi:5-methylcytosine-specific restriction endonuclease McrA